MEADSPRRLTALCFRWSARFGFFLRAEASNAGFGYPVPPRTAVLGLIANLIGLEKDALVTELAEARVAVRGAIPRTHWHCGNYRKVPPAALPFRVTNKGGRSSTAPEKNTRLRQEWLISPSYQVIAVLPEPHHTELRRRLEAGTSYFTPCMGLSEMLARVEYVGDEELEALEPGTHEVVSAVRVDADATIDTRSVHDQGLHAISLTMPRSVTAERRFDHALYFVEREGRPLPFQIAEAWSSSGGVLAFL